MSSLARKIIKLALSLERISSDKGGGPDPIKVKDLEVDFENQTGSFTLDLEIDTDLLGVNSLVEYPYVIRDPNKVYTLLGKDEYRPYWLKNPKLPLFDTIVVRFHEHYDKGNNPGGFEVSSGSKWRLSSLSFTGLELSGSPRDYDSNFVRGVVGVRVHGEFALRKAS